MSIVVVPKYARIGEGFSTVEKLEAAEHPGRRTDPARGYQSPSEWITQLMDLRKPVILCDFCRPKFDPKKARYRRFWCPDSNGQNGYLARGRCDDCKGDTYGKGAVFISEESYPQVCNEPGIGRRSIRARVRSAGQTAWGMIQSSLRR